MKILYYIILVSLYFFGYNLLEFYEIDVNLYYTSFLVLSVFCILREKSKFLKHKPLSFLIFFLVFYIGFKLLTDKGPGTRFMGLMILGAPLIYAAIPVPNPAYVSKRLIIIWRNIWKILISFYLIECIISIMERVMHYRFFRQTLDFDDWGEFRSASLQGHPLGNALLVSIIMNFILLSPLKFKYKFLLWFIGYISILCFNTRSSIIINAIFLCFYVILILLKKGVSLEIKRRILKYVLCVFSISGVLFFYYGLGDRLAKRDLLDESAMTRIYIWDIFNYYSVSDFLIGVDSVRLDYIMESLHLYVTENFWLDWVLRFGIIFVICILFFYYRLFKVIFYSYERKDILFLLLVFLSISFTNNSLSTSYMPLLTFLLCIELFRPKFIHFIIPTKYLERK